MTVIGESCAYGCGKGKTIVLNPDHSFSKQVKKKNTVYEIRDLFELGPEIVEIPKGCTLSFNGGALKGKGMLIGNNTTIVSSVSNILQGLSIRGTWKNRHVNVSWFLDNSQVALENAIAMSDSVIIDKDLTFTANLETVKSGLRICSEHKKLKQGIYGWKIQNVKDVKISGLEFYGTEKYIQGSTATALSIINGEYVTVEDCSMDGCYFYGFVFNSCKESKLDRCRFRQTGDVVRQMLAYAKHGEGIIISNNDFCDIGLVYAIRLDYCTQSHVIGNRMLNVKNNPILINSGCSFCTVAGNYLDGSDDSGILCANDPVWFVDKEATEETLHAEPPHDIIINNNVVKNMRDAGIGVYRDGSLDSSYSYNIFITENELIDNGLRSNADAYRNQVFIAARKVKVEGNKMSLSSANYNRHGVFIQSAYSAGEIHEAEDANIEINNNTYNNLTPVGSNHNSTGGADPSIISDVGVKKGIDINLYGKLNDGLPNGNKSVSWSFPFGGYPSLLTNDAQKKIFTIRSTSGNTESELICSFKDNKLFRYTCILSIEGQYKMDSVLQEKEKPCIVVLGTSMSGVRKSLDSSTEYVPFSISALLDKDTPIIKFVGTYATNNLYLKNVVVSVQYLNEN